MPNWVINHLTIQGENAAEVLKSLLIENTEKGGYKFDFNKVIPMPEDLRIVSGGITRDCAKLYINAMQEDCDAYAKYAALYMRAFRDKEFVMSETDQAKTMQYALLHKDFDTHETMFKNKADVYAYGKKALDNYATYGAKDWYDWSIENWGTKWNACDTEVIDTDNPELYFNTAWSAPIPVLDALSRTYPNLKFACEFADEDMGCNTGDIVLQNGEIIDGGFYDDQSKEAYEVAFRLWGCESYYKFNAKTGTYEYRDEEVM